jgi:hypothetical protein
VGFALVAPDIGNSRAGFYVQRRNGLRRKAKEEEKKVTPTVSSSALLGGLVARRDGLVATRFSLLLGGRGAVCPIFSLLPFFEPPLQIFMLLALLEGAAPHDALIGLDGVLLPSSFARILISTAGGETPVM